MRRGGLSSSNSENSGRGLMGRGTREERSMGMGMSGNARMEARIGARAVDMDTAMGIAHGLRSTAPTRAAFLGARGGGMGMRSGISGRGGIGTVSGIRTTSSEVFVSFLGHSGVSFRSTWMACRS